MVGRLGGKDGPLLVASLRGKLKGRAEEEETGCLEVLRRAENKDREVSGPRIRTAMQRAS